jgi:hypothetical protein
MAIWGALFLFEKIEIVLPKCPAGLGGGRAIASFLAPKSACENKAAHCKYNGFTMA